MSEDAARPDRVELVAAFGPALATVQGFHDLLAAEGVTRGLIGPREVPRLWERHLLNSAAVAPLLPAAGTLVDVGSGAGLPGVVLAALRPDLHVVLLEPMQRRATWLQEVVERLGLTSVEVVRGRAEEQHGVLRADAVTARAVAPLDRLAAWCMPLLTVGGVLLALKGEQAAEELASAAEVLDAFGAGERSVVTVSAGGSTTSVVQVRREHVTVPSTAPAATRRRRR